MTRSSSPQPKPRNEAERRAARWYRLRGYRIVGTNVWIAGFELDVIACRGRTLVFCEVKSKSGPGFGDPLEMVTPEKVRRIRRAAETWLDSRWGYRGHMVRYDVITVQGQRLRCIRAAF
jgi:putative endonuclease